MEPTVRSARIESAIGSDAARSSLFGRRFLSAGWSAVRNPVARNGIFGCRDRGRKIHPRDRYSRQRPGTLKIGGKIPAETASFRSTTVSAVREDWMVETEGTELPTPHAVVEPVSDTRVRNGNFRCRDGSAKSAVPPLRDRYRDALRFEKPPFWRH